MTKTLKTRRQFVSTTMIGLLAAPSLLRAQEPSAVRRNISSFSADPWQDHFDNLQHGAILCDIDSRAVQYWCKRPVSPRFQAFSGCQFQGMSSSMRLIL